MDAKEVDQELAILPLKTDVNQSSDYDDQWFWHLLYTLTFIW